VTEKLPDGFFRGTMWVNGRGSPPDTEPGEELFFAILGPGWVRVQVRRGDEVRGSFLMPTDGIAHIEEPRDGG
jgi:hypothetical protein